VSDWFFTSDLHGQGALYEQLVANIATRLPRAVLIGGDLAPHAAGNDGVALQRVFLQGFLVEFARRVKESSPDVPAKEQGYQPVEQLEASLGALASPADPPTGNNGYVAVRTAMEPDQIASALRATVRSIDPQLPLTQVQNMEYRVSESEAPRRFNTALISAFALAAVLLAALGIYSVIAFSADLRAQEMAIRMALGSQRAGILGLVFKSAVKLALAGCVVGLLGAGAVSRLLQSFLFGVSPFDPVVLTLAAVFVFLLALAASLLPARRAASIEPMRALRAD